MRETESDKKTNIKQKVKEVPQNWATGVHDSLDIMLLPVVKNAQEIDSNLIFTTPALQSVHFFLYDMYIYRKKPVVVLVLGRKDGSVSIRW